jgi:hypothetical protein
MSRSKDVLTLIGILICSMFLSGCAQVQPYSGTSPFEYREIHLPAITDEDGPEYLNDIDRDWGIWGHNLSVVLPEKPSPSVYAKKGISVNKEQFCFSSDALYGYIRDYIRNNFGSDPTMRFAILPNDNSIVCTCESCVACGNTEHDCSGAVHHLLERLCKEFPNHIFFTSHYRTTSEVPATPLPENAGVLVSAIDFPLSPVHTEAEDGFAALLAKWSGRTSRIYVWDYINNFDDYFTPYPIFDAIRHRLQLYVRHGVNGVFLNGSGYEYSTLYKLKTHVLAALLEDPELPWRPLLKSLCREMYPVTGDVISDFVTLQEDIVTEKGLSLPLYEGVPVAMKTYLPARDFVQFHDELLRLLPDTKGQELADVREMSRAMMLTRLELKRIVGDTFDCEPMLKELEESSRQGVIAYSESGGSTASYISEYRFMLAHAGEMSGVNLLKGVRLEPLTALDEDYSDVFILTDGLLGLPSNYHCGQLISSAKPALRIAIPYRDGMRRLRVYMTRNVIYHIGFPESLSLSAGDRKLGTVVPTPVPGNLQRAVAEFDVSSVSKGTFVLSVTRDPEERTMALDEIEAY